MRNSSHGLHGLEGLLVSAAASTPLQRRVWIDLGTSEQTLTKWDLKQNDLLVVVGVDALRENIEHEHQPRTPRFVRVQGACMPGSPSTMTMNRHRSPTCGSMLETRMGTPSVGHGNLACVGDEPMPTKVPSFPLSALIHKTVPRLTERIELLKIDVQGAELSCLMSGGYSLRLVDNILLEVQDATEESGLIMYEGSPTLSELDALLAVYGFTRQYCEWNEWMWLWRELNCLYQHSSPDASHLWATGNSQHEKRSMVSYAPYGGYVFRRFAIPKTLNTSSYFGARVQPPPNFKVFPLNQTRRRGPRDRT